MNVMALEAQKASLAREILCMEDESVIHDMWLFLKQRSPVLRQQEMSRKRQWDIVRPGKSKLSIEDAYGIFKGIDTSFEREEEDRI